MTNLFISLCRYETERDRRSRLGQFANIIGRSGASISRIEFAHRESPQKIHRNLAIVARSFQAYVSEASERRLTSV